MNCPDCGKEFARKFNMEHHRIVILGEADTEESFDESDHGTEASDEHDSSVEQKSAVDEGGNDDDDDSDDDEDEDDNDDSSSDSQSSTEEHEDGGVWSGKRLIMDNRVGGHIWWQKGWIRGGRHVSQWSQSGSLQMYTTKLETKHHHKLYEEKYGKPQTSPRPYPLKILTTRWKLQEHGDFEPEEAMRYAVKRTKIPYKKGHWHPEWWWTSPAT